MGGDLSLHRKSYPVGTKSLQGFAPQLTWSHYRALMRVDSLEARDFYEREAIDCGWSKVQLERQIHSFYFDRIVANQGKKGLLPTGRERLPGEAVQPSQVLKSPMVLEFLGLPASPSLHESRLEQAIIDNLQTFLLELGKGFSFVARQKRMSIGNDDFYLDLLFYHRHLRRLIAVELKLEAFQPAHTGQMELYLRWLDKHDRALGEESPMGPILCAGADAEQVALLQLDEKSIRVAEYLTELPPLPVLQERLHRAIELAREHMAKQELKGMVAERSRSSRRE